MSESESFDAFYARTVWNVTSQMHALAGEDSAADHAIREAYARAYQQWYEIADYPDTAGWVLAAAKEAYERRRPEMATRPPQQAPAGQDSLSWPGLYRPRATTGAPADPAATIGSPLVGMAAAPTVGVTAAPAADLASRPTAGGIGLVSGPEASAATAQPGAGQAAPPAVPGPPRQHGRPTSPGSRGRLIALTAAIAVIVAGGVVYLTTRGHGGQQPAQQHHTATKNQGSVMLPAGRTGSRTDIPWTLVGQGWTLAEVSSGAAGTSQPGTITTYLVDPKGGRYQIEAGGAAPSSPPQLLAWSGDAQNALLAVPSGTSGASYELLSLTTGQITNLQLPPNVAAVGFTRPEGQAIVAVLENPNAFKLQRYNLLGQIEATIGSLPRNSGSPDWLPGCGTACGALSSPDGDTDVWGITGDQMQLVGNAGGKVTKLTVPGAASCVPLRWWDTSTVLSFCGIAGQPAAGQLWLVPVDGRAPTQLTETSGSQSGNGDLIGAWQAAGTTYVTVTNFQQCEGAASGPGGLAVVPLSGQSVTGTPITVKGATNNHTSIVSMEGGKLLVLAQTGCPGTSSLLLFDPKTGATTTVLAGQSDQVGVLAAVPYGGLAPATIGH
ncbi:MAG TPA: hypothetical protein VH520_12680 [Streptosporangiaceae bacterium]|jgi:TolB protein